MANRCKKINFLLGDFNIDVLCNEVYAGVNMFSEHVLPFTEPTPLMKGCWIMCTFGNNLFMRKHANSKVNNIYFLDTNAVKTSIQKDEELEDDKEIDLTVS